MKTRWLLVRMGGWISELNKTVKNGIKILLMNFMLAVIPNALLAQQLTDSFNPVIAGVADPNLPRIIIRTTLIQPDKKIIVGGLFTQVNGTNANSIVRLNSDGTLDQSFNPHVDLNFADADVTALAIQSDGKILVGGRVPTPNPRQFDHLIRLNADGTYDSTFVINFTDNFTTFDGVNQIIVNEDDSFFASGSFEVIEDKAQNSVAKFEREGSLISSYNSNNSLSDEFKVRTIAKTDDGGLIVGGEDIVNGSSRGRLMKLDQNGDLDPTFSILEQLDHEVKVAKVLGNDKIIFGGASNVGFGENSRIPLYQIASNGTVEDITSAFLLGFANFQNLASLPSEFRDILISGEDIIIGGLFDSVNGLEGSMSLARLTLSGVVDTNFKIEINGLVNGIIREDDEHILVFGDFPSVNGIARTSIARINIVETPEEVVTSLTNSIGKNPSEFSVFPNPASNSIRVALENRHYREVTIEIFDIFGRQIRKESFLNSPELAEKTIDVSTINPGIYFLQLKDGDSNSIKRIAIER